MTPTMTPAEFKDARRALGLSAQSMALLLNVKSGRTIRRWESGERKVPGPASAAVALLLAASEKTKTSHEV